jgi:excinuclease ABC subunit C
VLHLVQRIRDESHRFAITYHRKRREMRDRSSELLEIAGVGARTRIRLVEHFGSVRAVQQAGIEALTAVVPRKTAERIVAHFRGEPDISPIAETGRQGPLHVLSNEEITRS